MKSAMPVGYYDVCELARAAKEIARAITEKRDHTYPANARQLEINIDQATGNFCIRDMYRLSISPDRLYSMFPALRADRQLVPTIVDGVLICGNPVDE